jgi:vacuolar-type H+-ATPase subunit E/Vma4
LNSNANKTERFLEAINSDAEARCNNIKKEVDDYIDNELKKARRLAHHNVRPVKDSELDRLNEEINAELSETETKGIEKLVERRNEITQNVFSQATAKIKTFTESNDYRSFLLNSAAHIKDMIGDDAVIILKPDDKRFESDIKALGNEVRYDELIKLGGCKGENVNSSLTADDTLDSRLESEKQKFYGYSGLSLSL